MSGHVQFLPIQINHHHYLTNLPKSKGQITRINLQKAELKHLQQVVLLQEIQNKEKTTSALSNGKKKFSWKILNVPDLTSDLLNMLSKDINFGLCVPILATVVTCLFYRYQEQQTIANFAFEKFENVPFSLSDCIVAVSTLVAYRCLFYPQAFKNAFSSIELWITQYLHNLFMLPLTSVVSLPLELTKRVGSSNEKPKMILDKGDPSDPSDARKILNITTDQKLTKELIDVQRTKIEEALTNRWEKLSSFPLKMTMNSLIDDLSTAAKTLESEV